jgi:hypothetical protein
MKIIFFIVSIILISLGGFSQGIISQRENLKNDVLVSLNYIYNNDFSDADKIINRIRLQHPDLPVHNLLSAIKFNWMILPKRTDDRLSPLIYNHLDKAIITCNKILEKEKDEEILFCKFSAHSLLAMHLSNDNQIFKSGEQARIAYSILKSGFKIADSNPDFFLTSGLYNFYAEEYPKENPVFKPIMLFFESGNTEKGIMQLKKASELGLFSKTEAKTYLAYIHLKYVFNPEESYLWGKKLTDEYPNNLYFFTNFLEASYLTNNFGTIYSNSHKLVSSDDINYQAIGNLFDGIYFEKEKKDISKAKTNYLVALSKINAIKDASNHHKSLIYLGLSRISFTEGNKKLAKHYLEKAEKSVEFKYVREEINKIKKSN